LKIAIIGVCGLIGKERLKAVQAISKIDKSIEICSIYDIDQESLFKINNIPIASNLDAVMETKPDWVFIVTPNDIVKQVAKKAFAVKANVLVEKPFGRSLKECNEIIALKPDECKLNVGFNYRFFAGIEQALNDAKNGRFGKLISVNMILAHGNSPGMEKSWRLDPIRCGDVVTDLGVHLFDLTLKLANGKPTINHANLWSGFWNTGIVEEAHWIATDESGTIFNSQVSLNRWRSTFKLEINGTEGYGVVENRGRSYGPQSYRIGKRWGWLSGCTQSESEELIIDNNDCSDSFIKETASVLQILGKYNSLSTACTYQEARNIMSLYDDYESKYIKGKYDVK
jgi:predicted dehydrogenase